MVRAAIRHDELPPAFLASLSARPTTLGFPPVARGQLPEPPWPPLRCHQRPAALPGSLPPPHGRGHRVGSSTHPSPPVFLPLCTAQARIVTRCAGPMSFSGKHVLVTGSNGGIGTVVAQQFLQEGARVCCLVGGPGGQNQGGTQTFFFVVSHFVWFSPAF